MPDLPKHPGPRFSLQGRSAHVNRMANMVDQVVREKCARGIMRDAEATEIARYNADVIGTFRWLVDHETDIRALVKLPPADRAALIAHLDVAVAAAVRALEDSQR